MAKMAGVNATTILAMNDEAYQYNLPSKYHTPGIVAQLDGCQKICIGVILVRAPLAILSTATENE